MKSKCISRISTALAVSVLQKTASWRAASLSDNLILLRQGSADSQGNGMTRSESYSGRQPGAQSMSLTGCLYRGKGFRLFASDILGTWSSFFFGSHNLSSFVEVGYVFLCLVLILVCKERKRIWLEVMTMWISHGPGWLLFFQDPDSLSDAVIVCIQKLFKNKKKPKLSFEFPQKQVVLLCSSIVFSSKIVTQLWSLLE